ncbi:MAG: hypothetical protein MUE71_05515 [Chitinophagaceae bacterium]|nr:hypothetical protein [Chitinophagaceae bacterium]
MERLPSLINRLKERQEEGALPNELLLMLDEIRRELNSKVALSDHTRSSVAVWVPAGYFNQEEVVPIEKKQAINENIEVESEVIEQEVSELEVLQNGTISTVKVSAQPIFSGVPKPPVSIVEEETEEFETVSVNEVNALVEPGIFIEELIDEKKEEETQEFLPDVGLPPSSDVKHEPDDADEPLVFELELPDHDFGNPAIQPGISKSFLEETERFISSISLEEASPSKPKEIHEILAERVVAKPESNQPVRRVLAESLSGGKINDLRKAISINDRFRFIKSLFRGDETLYDRSIKTINNFNILPEAQYWIQRELVIKLGWNDEDELVQTFYDLVGRRFL